jgi:hypothetical protein
MGLAFPINTHGVPFKKASVSATTKVAATRATPFDNVWPVILLTPAERGDIGFQKDEEGNPVSLKSAREAREYFGDDGDAADLARYIFNPSTRGNAEIRGPNEVYPLRVGSPTQASLNLDNTAAADALLLTSRNYGTKVNDIEVKVANAAVKQKITFTIAGTVLVGETFTVTINGTTHPVTGNISPTEVVAALVAAIDGGAEAAKVDATDADPIVEVESLVAGQPFSFSSSTDSAAGTITSAIATRNVYPNHVLDFRKGTTNFSTPSIGSQFELVYSGTGAKPTITITRSGGIATALSATTGVSADDISITDLSTYTTIGDLVAYLNSLANWSCVLLTTGSGSLASSALDAKAAIGVLDIGLDEVPDEIEADGVKFTTNVENLGIIRVGHYVREDTTATWKQITKIEGVKAFVAEALTPDATPTLRASINIGIEGTAILPALEDQIDRENELVTAGVVEAGNDGAGLIDLAFTLLSSETAGTNPAVTNQDWINARTEIEQKFKRSAILVVNSTLLTIQGDFSAFAVDSFNNDRGLFPFYTGVPRGESKAQVLNRPVYVDSRFGKIFGHGVSILDVNGKTKEVDGVYGAAMMAGQVAGSGLEVPLTLNPVPIVAIEGDRTDDDIKDYLTAGVNIAEDDPDVGFALQIGVTTSQKTDEPFENYIFLDHQRNSLERAMKQRLKRRFLGKAATQVVIGGMRDTVIQLLQDNIDRGEGTGFLRGYGSVIIEALPTGLVKVTYEAEHISEIAFMNITGYARLSTFVDITKQRAA